MQVNGDIYESVYKRIKNIESALMSYCERQKNLEESLKCLKKEPIKLEIIQ